jgi:tetratricopeptide (TPR) repeat protein
MALAPDRWGATAMVNYYRLVELDSRAALGVLDRVRADAVNADVLRSRGSIEVGLGQLDAGLAHLREAQRLDPRSSLVLRNIGNTLNLLRRYSEARPVFDLANVIAPGTLTIISGRAKTFLGEGDLEGARASIAEATQSIDPKQLVALIASNDDLGWVLTDPQKDLLLTLTPESFDGDEAVRALCFMQQYSWKGDQAATRQWAEKAARALEQQLKDNPADVQRFALRAWALAGLGRHEEAIRDGRRAVEMRPVSADVNYGPYFLEILAKIYTAVGESDQAIDTLGELLKAPSWVSPRWLAIDPNYAPLRGNPRFQKLVGKT